MVRFALLMFAMASVVAAEGSWLRFVERSTAVAACAVSAYDGWQSAAYLDGRHGVTESTSLYRRPDGTVRLPALSISKALLCVGPALAAEKLPERYRPAMFGAVGANLGLQLFTIWRNRSLIHSR